MPKHGLTPQQKKFQAMIQLAKKLRKENPSWKWKRCISEASKKAL